MKIYLIRHGECPSNALKIYNYLDESLNEVGIKQANILKDKIKNIDYDVIISSPIKRALETANIINAQNKDIIIDENLRERELGNLTGKPLDSIDRSIYWNYYNDVNFAEEERIPDLCNRVYSFIDDLKSKPYKNVLIVAHSGVSKAFYCYFNGIPISGDLEKVGLKNTEIKEYDL